jgi:hypothetical protein
MAQGCVFSATSRFLSRASIKKKAEDHKTSGMAAIMSLRANGHCSHQLVFSLKGDMS